LLNRLILESQTISQLAVPSMRSSSPLAGGINNGQQQSYTAGANFTCRNLQESEEELIRLEKSNIMLLGRFNLIDICTT
jgi:hypothetical protein